MVSHSVRSRSTALGCAVLVGTLLLPGQAAAEPAARPTTVKETARALAIRHAGEMRTARAAQSTAAAPELESGSFFKTPVGVAVLVAFTAGVGYAVYSSSNDRIKSPGR